MVLNVKPFYEKNEMKKLLPIVILAVSANCFAGIQHLSGTGKMMHETEQTNSHLSSEELQFVRKQQEEDMYRQVVKMCIGKVKKPYNDLSDAINNPKEKEFNDCLENYIDKYDLQ